MTTTTQIIIRTGTTAQVQAYTGPLGELVLDTQTNTVYVQDGSVAGGHAIGGAAVDSAVANLQVQVASITGSAAYGNANVAAYIPLDSTITTLQSNTAILATNLSILSTDVSNIINGGEYFGNLVPHTTDAYNLGSANVTWGNIYGGNIIATSYQSAGNIGINHTANIGGVIYTWTNGILTSVV